jgi:hypothetical protein
MCFVGKYSRFEETGFMLNNVNGASGHIRAV